MAQDNQELAPFEALEQEIETRWWPLNQLGAAERSAAYEEAAMLLAAGKTVAFPTETVYGLGGDARSTTAVEAIFAAKGRPSDNPLIVHVADQRQVDELVKPYGETAAQLMAKFWPGPLTIVLPVREDAVSSRVTAGLDTVAVRMPDHPVALELIRASGCPIAAPSANRSGRPSPTRAEHVRADLDGRIAGIVDGGATGVGVESTVVAVNDDGSIQVLRPGGITPAMLREVSPQVTIDPAVDPERGMLQAAASKGETQEAAAPRSPGMKYRHYAPKGVMQLVQGESAEAVSARIQAELDDAKQRGEKTGVLAFSEHVDQYRADVVVELGSMAELSQAAHLLYDALRQFDDEGATYILAEACPSDGMGLAVMNRLVKAAGHRLIRV